MAEFAVHIKQADHNRQVALALLQQEPFHDWAITAAFYSAIHLFEAWLYHRGPKHSETDIPRDDKGDLKFSPHAWREKLVTDRLPRHAFKDYRHLKESSETARYLSLPRSAGPGANWTPTGAWEHLSLDDARRMVNNHLASFTKTLDLEYSQFIESIDFESTVGNSAPIVRQTLIRDYSDRQSLMKESLSELRRKYGAGVAEAFRIAAEKKPNTAPQ